MVTCRSVEILRIRDSLTGFAPTIEQQHQDHQLLAARLLDHVLGQQALLLRLGERSTWTPARNLTANEDVSVEEGGDQEEDGDG